MNQSTLPTLRHQTLTIIVPVFNESSVLPEFFNRIESIIKQLECSVELLFVDDGSSDETCAIINASPRFSDSLKLIKLSRNFGKEAALCAGLKAATGDAVVIIDADLQDPPQLVVEMVKAWKAGADVVNMRRSNRQEESWFKALCAKYFYKILNHLSDTNIPENVGDFRLMARKVVDVINAMPEKNLYMKGILSWPGFTTKTLCFNRDSRYAGESKWPFFKLIKLALDGIASFSTRPLRLATWTGGLLAVIAFLYGVFVLFKTLFWGESVAGYPTLMLTILILGGFQLLSVGILGAYIGRIYIEVQNRPRYVVKEEVVLINKTATIQSIHKDKAIK